MSRKKWETLLNEATALIKQSRENIYDAVTRMVQVAKDADFAAFYGGDLDKATGCLDDLLSGFGLNYGETELMLHYFPAKDQWKQMPLNDMLAESIVKRNAERKAEDPKPKGGSSRPTKQDMERVTGELAQEREKSTRLASEIAKYSSSEDQLRAKIRDLEQENARLRGRIEELERMVKRETMAV